MKHDFKFNVEWTGQSRCNLNGASLWSIPVIVSVREKKISLLIFDKYKAIHYHLFTFCAVSNTVKELDSCFIILIESTLDETFENKFRWKRYRDIQEAICKCPNRIYSLSFSVFVRNVMNSGSTNLKARQFFAYHSGLSYNSYKLTTSATVTNGSGDRLERSIEHFLPNGNEHEIL